MWQESNTNIGLLFDNSFKVYNAELQDINYCYIWYFQVQDCHVVNYLSKEQNDGRSAALVVGGKNASPFYVRKNSFCEHTWGSGLDSAVKCADLFFKGFPVFQLHLFTKFKSLEKLFVWFRLRHLWRGGCFFLFFSTHRGRSYFQSSLKPPCRPLAPHQTPVWAERKLRPAGGYNEADKEARVSRRRRRGQNTDRRILKLMDEMGNTWASLHSQTTEQQTKI